MTADRWAARALPWQDRLYRWLLAVLFVIGACAVLLVDLQGDRIDLEASEISPVDVRATRAITYVSARLTEQERQRAEEAVAPVYEPVDARVRRDQIAQARAVLAAIDTLRANPSSTPTAADATVLTTSIFDPTLVTTTLTLSDAAWARVKAEMPTVLDRALRDEIREDQLEAKRRQVPTLVGLELSEEESAVTAVLVQALMRPNSRYNAEKTAEAREQANARVAPVMVSVQKGEIILRAGDRVQPEDLETLEALDLRQSDWSWPEALRTVSVVVLLVLLLAFYVTRFIPEFWGRRRQAILFVALLLLFILGARWMIPGHAVQPYLFPAAALTMLVSLLIDVRLTAVTILAMTLLVAFLTQGALDLVLYVAAGSLAGMLVLGRGDRISLFLLAGVAVSAVNLLIVAIFHLVERSLDWTGMSQLALAAVINGTLASSLTLLGVYLLSPLVGVVTSLHLAELEIAPVVGAAAAAEFHAYIELYSALPDLDRILHGTGERVPFPSEPSARYATVIGLTLRAADAQQGYHALAWLANTAAAEWVQLFATDIFRRMRALGQMGTFAQHVLADEKLQVFLQAYERMIT